MNRSAFYAALRARTSGAFGTSLTASQVAACSSMPKASDNDPNRVGYHISDLVKHGRTFTTAACPLVGDDVHRCRAALAQILSEFAEQVVQFVEAVLSHSHAIINDEALWLRQIAGKIGKPAKFAKGDNGGRSVMGERNYSVGVGGSYARIVEHFQLLHHRAPPLRGP
jgi:hypothetical protein